MKRVKQIYFVVVGLIVLVWITLLTAMGIFKEQEKKVETLHRVEVIYSSSLSIILAFFFILFGSKMYAGSKNSSKRFNKISNTKRSVSLSFIYFSLDEINFTLYRSHFLQFYRLYCSFFDQLRHYWMYLYLLQKLEFLLLDSFTF